MGKATYWQRGETIDYINGTSETIEAGVIVPFGKRVGVIGAPILPGDIGSLVMEGVFEMPKDDGEVEAGDTVYYDADSGNVTATTKPAVAGYAIKPAAAGDGFAVVKLLG